MISSVVSTISTLYYLILYNTTPSGLTGPADLTYDGGRLESRLPQGGYDMSKHIFITIIEGEGIKDADDDRLFDMLEGIASSINTHGMSARRANIITLNTDDGGTDDYERYEAVVDEARRLTA